MVLLREIGMESSNLIPIYSCSKFPCQSPVLSKRMLVRYHHFRGVVFFHFDHTYTPKEMFPSHCLYYFDVPNDWTSLETQIALQTGV